MFKNEKLIVAGACTLTVFIAAGFTITQGEMKSNKKEYNPINVTNQNQIKINYEVIEKNISENLYKIKINEDVNNEQLLQIANEITSENNEQFTIYVECKNNQIEITKDEEKTLITRHIPVDNEVEGLPENYKVLNIEHLEDKTEINIEISEANDPNIALGQVKSIGQKIKNEEIQKGNSISSLEIKAYYNDENCYWSYSSSNKNAINNNQLVKN